MISYVVPTMWKYEPFVDFLKDLVDHHLIGEIILIDNDPINRPQSDVFLNAKIKILTQGKNIFVNPAWNWGVSEAKFDKIAIANDDILFDARVFKRVYDFIIPEFGPAGLSVLPNEMYHVDGLIRIREWSPGINTFGFGMLMFVNKLSWTIIPNELDIYFGDNFIFDSALWQHKKIHVISDIFYHSPYGQTGKSLPELSSFMKSKFEKEKIVYSSIIQSNGYDPKYWCPEHYSS